MFDFLALSRELRDLIYQESLVPQKWFSFKEGIQTRPERGPANNLLLVSRQFSQEYTESSKRSSTFTFVDVAGDGLILEHVSRYDPVPETLLTAKAFHFKLWLMCGDEGDAHMLDTCNSVTELKTHATWIKSLLDEVLGPKVVTVTIYMPHEEQVEECRPFIQAEKRPLTELPGFQGLVVAVADYSTMRDGPSAAEIELKWDRETDTLQKLHKSDDQKTLEALPVRSGVHGVSEAGARKGLSNDEKNEANGGEDSESETGDDADDDRRGSEEASEPE